MQNETGGYCPQCDTVWAAPGKCNCDPQTYRIVNVDKALAPSKFERDIWNEAIEAAAKVSETENVPQFYIAEQIRKLKK